MAVPTYRCWTKVDTTNDQGITCENVNCGLYDIDSEDCGLILLVQTLLKSHGRTEPNNA